MRVERDISYRPADDGLAARSNTLDLYYVQGRPRDPKKPIVVFIHGGNWIGGDKSFPDGHQLPAWFAERQAVFVSLNFRLASESGLRKVTVADMADDIARAMKWLVVNRFRIGAGKNSFILFGYSSGAHLASLIATDQRYLRKYGMSVAQIRGVIAADIPQLDVVRAIHTLETEDIGLSHQNSRLALLYKLFGSTRATQESVSPAAYVGPWLRNIAFLLLTTGRHAGCGHSFSRRMAEHFSSLLRAQGVLVEHHHFDSVEHADLLGHVLTQVLDSTSEFLDRVLSPGEDGKAAHESGDTVRTNAEPAVSPQPPKGVLAVRPPVFRKG